MVGVRDGRKLDVYHRGKPLVAWKLTGNMCKYSHPARVLGLSSLCVNGMRRKGRDTNFTIEANQQCKHLRQAVTGNFSWTRFCSEHFP